MKDDDIPEQIGLATILFPGLGLEIRGMKILKVSSNKWGYEIKSSVTLIPQKKGRSFKLFNFVLDDPMRSCILDAIKELRPRDIVSL